MNEQGNVILFIIAGMIIIALLPPIIMMVFPAASLIFQIMMIFIIYSTVRGYVGSNAMTLVISAILIYFLVFKYAYITASVWVIQLMLGIQFFSVIVWGIGTRMKR